jgi:hypothetical protein
LLGKVRQTSRPNGAAHHGLPAECGTDAHTCDDIDVVELSIPRAKFVTFESDTHVVLAGEPAWPRLTSEIAVFPAE